MVLFEAEDVVGEYTEYVRLSVGNKVLDEVLPALMLSRPLTLDCLLLGSFLEKSSIRDPAGSSPGLANTSSVRLLFLVLSLFKSTYSKFNLIGMNFSMRFFKDEIVSVSKDLLVS